MRHDPNVSIEQPAPQPGSEDGEGMNRRSFLTVLGSGLLITVSVPALGQRRGRREPSPVRIAARLHVGEDGLVTVLTGKVEGGQGARAELTQAAAEELRLLPDRVRLIMGDTDRTPDDGITAGSRTTPQTLPAVRAGAAAARELLIDLAASLWNVDRSKVALRDGQAVEDGQKRKLTYAELAKGEQADKAFAQPVPRGVTLTAVKEWKVLGTSLPRPDGRELVTGRHRFPSDITRPGMLYGAVLRAPSYGAKLTKVDLAPARAIAGVQAVQDGPFVGVAGPTSWAARKAIEALAKTAQWEEVAQPSSDEVYAHLRRHARGADDKPFADELAKAPKTLRRTYHTAYIQHAPLEPRAAVAEWADGKATVWMATQNPFGCRREIASAMGLDADRVRVIVPDFGGGFGGKHTADAGLEAARLAKAFGKPVQIRWTREEEFTWAYFRPAAVIDAEASLDAQGKLTSWHFVNINSGGAGVNTPYRTGKNRSHHVPSNSPLRQGSYRALAATANNFARECFMDELAELAGADPLAFRLAHLDDPRLRAVLEEAARRFGWAERRKKRQPGVGVGLACGKEKDSVVAACVEVAVGEQADAAGRRYVIRQVVEVFECGAVLNPDNLRRQVEGCILMGLGAVLGEEMRFEKGRILNASFWRYPVPRFADVPPLDIHLLDRPDQTPVGAGETPIIAIAPAIANAIFYATGRRLRSLPLRLDQGDGDRVNKKAAQP